MCIFANFTPREERFLLKGAGFLFREESHLLRGARFTFDHASNQPDFGQ